MRPSLLLDFANTRRLDPRITFTRASVGTYFDRNGVLKTAGVNEPRFDYDPITGYCKGLLIEEARTNLLLYSEQLDNAVWGKTNVAITPDAAVAPDGAMTADLCTGTGGGLSTINKSLITASATTMTCSVYTKAGSRTDALFLLRNSTTGTSFSTGVFTYATGAITGGWTSTYVGNGWWRISYTASTGIAIGDSLSFYVGATGGSNISVSDNWYVWGAQVEAGAFATSYIPTAAAAVTRAADVASMSTAGWLNSAEGSLFVDASNASGIPASATSPRVASLLGATAADSAAIIRLSTSGYAQGLVRVGGASQAQIGALVWNAGMSVRSALAYKASDFAIASNGAAAVTSSGGTVPAMTQLYLGQAGDGTSFFNGPIARLAYYPRRLANADLQELTR